MKIRIESYDETAARSLERARKMDRGERIEPEVSLSFESIEDFMEVLTPARIRLFKYARTQPFTYAALAAGLGRNETAVRRDVKALSAVGFLKIRDEENPGHGRVKVIEAVAEQFEVQAAF